MAVLRKEKKNNFTIIDNAIFKDYALSYKAKGLLCQMLSLPDGWEWSIEGLTKLSSDGISAVRSALDELERAGYFRRRQVRKGNRIAGIEYIISETKMCENLISENLISENLILENLISENQPQLNTKESNTDLSNTDVSSTHIGKRPRKPKNADLNNTPSLRPSIEDIEGYIREKDLDVDGRKFFDFFDASEWIDSKGNPVRNWKQKLITWSSNNDNGRSGKKRQGIRGTVGKGDGSVRDGAPKWFKPFEAFPSDERSQDDA